MILLKKLKYILLAVVLILLLFNSPGQAEQTGDLTATQSDLDGFIRSLDLKEDKDFHILPSDNLDNLTEREFKIVGYTNFLTGNDLELAGTDRVIYFVVNGDTLYKIAQKYNVSISKIKEMNNLSTDILHLGQRLYIPFDIKDGGDYRADEIIYTVQPGDSLHLISERFEVDLSAVKERNDLYSDILYVGQKLYIPKNNDSIKNEIYTVRSGDSLYTIAQNYGITIDEIKNENNLSTDILYIGQKLYIPADDSSENENNDNRTDNKLYYVQPGDSLYKIAERFYTKINIIRELNNLSSENLYVGQKLYVPLPDISGDYDTVLSYVVEKPWETIYSIGEEFNISVWVLKAYNQLESDSIYPGQKLSIPLSLPDGNMNDGFEYTQEELELLARAVYSEARGESFKGEVAVAAVILNRVRHSIFPDTIEGVIFQPWQFTAVHDGQFWLEPEQHAYLAAKAALQGWDPTREAIYYYNPDTATSDWVYYRNVVIKIGDHYFAV